jgi:hypothetical protein
MKNCSQVNEQETFASLSVVEFFKELCSTANPELLSKLLHLKLIIYEKYSKFEGKLLLGKVNLKFTLHRALPVPILRLNLKETQLNNTTYNFINWSSPKKIRIHIKVVTPLLLMKSNQRRNFVAFGRILKFISGSAGSLLI